MGEKQQQTHSNGIFIRVVIDQFPLNLAHCDNHCDNSFVFTAWCTICRYSQKLLQKKVNVWERSLYTNRLDVVWLPLLQGVWKRRVGWLNTWMLTQILPMASFVVFLLPWSSDTANVIHFADRQKHVILTTFTGPKTNFPFSHSQVVCCVFI